MNRIRTTLLSPLVVVVSLLIVQCSVEACSVCYGDPDSKMTHGAFAGVLVLFGIIAMVLAGVVGTGIYWTQRSRRLALLEH